MSETAGNITNVSLNDVNNRCKKLSEKVNALFDQTLQQLKNVPESKKDLLIDIKSYEDAIAKHKIQKIEAVNILTEESKLSEELNKIQESLEKAEVLKSLEKKDSLEEEELALNTDIKSYRVYFDTNVEIMESSGDIFIASVMFSKSKNPTLVHITINRKERKIIDVNVPSISKDVCEEFKKEILNENGCFDITLLLKKIYESKQD